jgi:transposase
MKRKTLQMLKGIDKNVARTELIVKCLAHEIGKTVGKQKRGRRRMNLQYVAAGILYQLKFGIGWAHLPSEFGNGKTIYGWFRIFTQHQIGTQMWQQILKHLELTGKLRLSNITIDGSLVQMMNGGDLAVANPRNHNKKSLNRSILVDSNGKILYSYLMHGTAHDSRAFIPLFNQVCSALNAGFCMHGDKAFDAFTIRYLISWLGGKACIPARNHGYTAKYKSEKDSKRWKVERTNAWISQFKSMKLIFVRLTECIEQFLSLTYAIICSRFLSIKQLKLAIRS